MRASSPFCKDGKPSGSDLQVGKLGLLAALSCSATRLAKTLLELVDSTSGINESLLPCKEGMACRADTDMKVLNR